VVKPGDTLIRIGLDTGQNWRDIVRWNGIQNPNLIEVGQVLRVVPPGQDPGAAVTRPVQAASRVESRPLEPRPADSAAPVTPSPVPPAPPASAAQSGVSAAAPAGPAPAGTPSAAPRTGDDAIDWAWPAAGTVTTPFDEARGVKGLSILGKAGDPVLAAADGRVVYAGSGLRGYGNLVIVKHNNTFLTAYAHNQTLLVKEEQAVRRGQKIAEMGSSDADQVKLHFEIRRLGKPVDPARLLPAR
jgi:lipoprotein NlpD